jgi:hypothetical protein
MAKEQWSSSGPADDNKMVPAGGGAWSHGQHLLRDGDVGIVGTAINKRDGEAKHGGNMSSNSLRAFGQSFLVVIIQGSFCQLYSLLISHDNLV